MLRFASVLLTLALGARALAAPELAVTVTDAKGEAVPEAVIALYSLDTPAPVPPPGAPVEIVQKEQEYSPYVTVVTVGTAVVFPNRDTIQHHIYSLSKAKRFEKPLYAPGAHESIVFDQPGIVTLGCNIHDWMIAYVVILPTPYFWRTDSRGSTHIAAPPGRYRVEIWHPRLAKNESRELTLAEGTTPLEWSLKLKPDRRIRRSPEGKASGY